ncbi:MAG: hypothetical protein ACR2M1_04780 [Gemmatimonadaceae bacterium]
MPRRTKGQPKPEEASKTAKRARVAQKYAPTAEDRKKVYLLAGLGDRNEDVALVIGISERALRMHYPAELAKGRLEANAKVKQTAFKMATSGTDTAMTIFWLKTRCGWKEISVVQTQELPQIVVE